MYRAKGKLTKQEQYIKIIIIISFYGEALFLQPKQTKQKLVAPWEKNSYNKRI